MEQYFGDQDLYLDDQQDQQEQLDQGKYSIGFSFCDHDLMT